MGFKRKEIEKYIEKIKPPPGRLEYIKSIKGADNVTADLRSGCHKIATYVSGSMLTRSDYRDNREQEV